MVDNSNKNLELMFNKISKNYDFMNNIISFGTQKLIKRNFIKNITFNKNSTVLDLCTGSGDLAFELSKNKNIDKIIGIDFSKNMLKIARKKNKSKKIEFIEKDCSNLNIEKDSIDVVVMGFGLRNLKNYEIVISEIHKVLKTEGQFAHIDIFKGPKIINFLFDIYVKIMAGIFSNHFDSYNYLLNSKNNFLSEFELSKKIEKLGFKKKLSKTYAFGMIKTSLFYKINE